MIDLPYEDRTIGKHQYRCTALFNSKWLELSAVISKILGMQVLEIDEKNLGAYATQVFSRSSVGDFKKIFELLGECLYFFKEDAELGHITTQNQERWWAAFRSELPGVLQLFFEVQFKDFFTGLDVLSPGDKNPQKGQEKKKNRRRRKSPST